MKRHQITKEQDGSPLTPADLSVGETVTIYGRTFFVVDADTFTRKWYAEQMGLELAGPGTYPADPVDAYRKQFGLDKTPSECAGDTVEAPCTGHSLLPCKERLPGRQAGRQPCCNSAADRHAFWLAACQHGRKNQSDADWCW